MAILDVTVDAGAPEREMAAVRDAFAGAGVEAVVDDNLLRHGADALPYVIAFMAPVTWVAAQFASGFMSKAGEDSWDAFRDDGWRGLVRLMRELSAARGEREGTITIRDPVGPDLHLSSSIPEEALRLLASLDWSAMNDGWLMWTALKGEWWFVQAHRASHGIPAPR